MKPIVFKEYSPQGWTTSESPRNFSCEFIIGKNAMSPRGIFPMNSLLEIVGCRPSQEEFLFLEKKQERRKI
jgi:hypothetical protein